MGATANPAANRRPEAGYQETVRLLADPAAYAERPRRVELVETHISCVFLTDRRAYKLKKPVRYEFLDFTTADRRRHACQEEVRLNRRLAPHVYRRVAPVTIDDHGRLALDGRGRSVDWVVEMCRLPADAMLDHLIRAGRLTDEGIQQLAVVLTAFYQQAPPLTLRPGQYRCGIESHVLANLDELLSPDHQLPAIAVRRVHAGQMRLLKLAPEALDQRVCDGRIVDGHGDLRPEHVCLLSPPVVYDCIEFDPLLRQIDVADELSFFAMECDRLHAHDVGRQVIAEYCRASHDDPPAPLMDFYKCYRACVRAKVAALRGRQISGVAAAEARSEAREYLQLADRYVAGLGRPALVVVRGISGTGKSTLARSIAEALGAQWLSTDVIRRELLGRSRREAAYGQGIYTDERRRHVYQEMNRRAEMSLSERVPVVMDGTFLSTAARREAVALAERHGAVALMVHCHCADDLARRRVEMRRQRKSSPSEVRPELLAVQKISEQSDPPGVFSTDVDASECLTAQSAAVLRALRQLDPVSGWGRTPD